MFDNDGFTPRGVTGHIVFVIVGLITVGILIGVVLNLVYEVNVESENGPGVGIPMHMASDATNTWLTVTQTDDGLALSGSYNGMVDISSGIILLANNQAVYVSEGELHYYNGLTDSVITDFTAHIGNGRFNDISFEWLYYPHPDGLYRAYDGSVDYEVNDSVAGIGSSNGNVIISMNDTVDSNNSGNDVFVYIDRSEEGIEGIYYRWE